MNSFIAILYHTKLELQSRNRDRLIDTFLSKIVLFNDKFYVTLNIKGADGKKLTVEQIIKDFENEKIEPCEKFDLDPNGDLEGTRTLDLRRDRAAF